MANNNTTTGRPLINADWQRVDQLILNGDNLKQIASSLSVSPKTLNAMSLRTHGQSFLVYSSDLKARVGQTIRAFNFEDTHALLIHYYSGKLSRLDNARGDKLPPVRAWYPRTESPSTGKRLMEQVTARELDLIMARLYDKQLLVKGVSVTRGHEYPLMCWINPNWQNDVSYQKTELPPLLEYVENRKYLETRNYWDLTPLGLKLVKKSLLEFNKHMYLLLSQKQAKPKQKDIWE